MKKMPYELHLTDIWKRERVRFGISSLVKLPYTVLRSVQMAKLKTYYPELERKSYLNRVVDNVVWAVKNFEPNLYYTSYGLDIKNFHKAEDYLPYREFKLRRESAQYNYAPDVRWDSKILLRDKYVFSCFMISALGEGSVPKAVAVIDNGVAYLFESRQNISAREFFSVDRRVFCKLIDGECGDSVMLLESKNGMLKNGKDDMSFEYLEGVFKGTRFIVQEVVEQHELVNKLNPSCVNTIRIITVRGKSGLIQVFAASMRLGVKKDSFVDNRAVGGMAVGIDEKGCLKKYGFQHVEFGGKSECHPVTGTRFEGYQLPYWYEVEELVKRAHSCIVGIESIGWDVAITPDGPILIEGNDNWEMPNPQDSHGGLKKRWYKMLNA